MRDDAGIEERGGLQGIFAGEECPDELASRLVRRPVGGQMMPDSLKMLQEDAAKLDVPPPEVGVHLLQHRGHLGVAERQDAGEDLVDTGYAAGIPGRHERPHQHPRGVGFDGK